MCPYVINRLKLEVSCLLWLTVARALATDDNNGLKVMSVCEFQKPKTMSCGDDVIAIASVSLHVSSSCNSLNRQDCGKEIKNLQIFVSQHLQCAYKHSCSVQLTYDEELIADLRQDTALEECVNQQMKKYLRIRYFCISATELGLECSIDSRGAAYTGTRAITRTNKTCAYWSDITEPAPYGRWGSFTITPQMFPAKNLKEMKNFCRNPYGLLPRPVCYVAKEKKLESCKIEYCKHTENDERSIITEAIIIALLLMMTLALLILCILNHSQHTKRRIRLEKDMDLLLLEMGDLKLMLDERSKTKEALMSKITTHIDQSLNKTLSGPVGSSIKLAYSKSLQTACITDKTESGKLADETNGYHKVNQTGNDTQYSIGNEVLPATNGAKDGNTINQ